MLYNEVDWGAVCDVLKVYGVDENSLDRVKVFHIDASPFVKMKGGESFRIHGDETSLWNITSVCL